MKKLIRTLLFSVGFAVLGVAQSASSAPVQGKDYTVLSTPQPVSAPAGKVEVIEFMWYGCPHCNEFDPYIEKWKAKQGPDVEF
jgi:thiol:disulfide interchange protein DsbA